MWSQLLQRARPGAVVWHRLAVLLALAGGVAPAPAQNAPPPLTLVELYHAVDSANPRITGASALGRAAVARVPGSGKLPDPRVTLQLMNRNLPGLGLADPLGMNQVQVTQMVPVAGQLGFSKTAAAAAAAAATAGAVEVTWEQRTLAAMAFYDLYQAGARIEVVRETLRLLDDLATTLTAMYVVGDARQADVLRARVEVGRMRAEIEDMRAMEGTMTARLNGLLNRAAATPLGRPVVPDFPSDLPSRDSLMALASGERAMLRGGRATVDEATALARRARREIWPDLELSVAYGQRPMPEGGTDRMVSLMVGASLPIWAGSRQLRMRDEAGAMRQMAIADLEAMEADTRARIGEVLAELERAKRLHQLYRDAILPQAEATVVSARSAYQVGTVDFMTLLDAIMTVNRFREEIIRLRSAEGIAFAELEMLTGRPLVSGLPIATESFPGAER